MTDQQMPGADRTFGSGAEPTGEPHETTAAPAVTSPVTVSHAPRTGRSRVRWLVAAVVTAFVVVGVGGATLMLTGAAGDPGVLTWTPKDSVMYAELRLDLPGGQEAELAKAMRAFPGFDDQAAFPTKLNEALDQLVKSASEGTYGYSADIEPWFGGQIAISAGPLPATADAKAARALLLASVTDGAKASAWADKLLATTGATTTTETYNGTTITIVTPPSSDSAATDGMTAAYALFGPVIGVGDPASVKAAIDTRGTAGLATNDQFKTASASVTGDRLGFLYVDAAAIASGAKALAPDAAASAMPEVPAVLGDLTTPWMVAALRASNGSFVVDTRTPHVASMGPASPSTSKLPSVLPATTVMLAEGHDVGKSLEQLKSLLAADPQLADGVQQVDDALKLVGGYAAVVDWMGEAGVAVTLDGDKAGGGIVVTPTDPASAGRLLTQLRAFLELAGASGTSGIKVSDQTYGDATITTIDLGDLGGIAGGTTGSDLPSLPANVSIAYSVTDQVVVLGVGTDFVKAVLDARSGPSLATSSRFSAALGSADKEHGSLFWLDVAGIRSFAESMIPAADKADYDANTKPYLEAIDSIIGTNAPGDPLDRGTLVIRTTGQ
jgi:hypothetical protein